MFVQGGGLASRCQESVQDAGMATGGSKVHRTAAMLVPEGWVSMGREQHLHTVLVTIGYLHMGHCKGGGGEGMKFKGAVFRKKLRQAWFISGEVEKSPGL